MSFLRITVASIVSAVAILGCASDPGKKVSSAETQLTSDQQKERSGEQDKNAEATNAQETARAESSAKKDTSLSALKKDVAMANADLAQDRRDFDAKVKERLAKLDAKAKELKTKSEKLSGKKSADFKAHQTMFMNQRADANTKMTSAENSTSDGWATAKADVQTKLDSLESTLESMEKDL